MSQVAEHYNNISPTIDEPEAGENILNYNTSIYEYVHYEYYTLFIWSRESI